MTGESWGLQDPEERMAPRGPRAAPVSLETLDLWDPTVKRESWVYLDCQATQEDKDQRDLRASKVSRAPTERKERGAQLGSPAQGDREGRRGLVERGARGDPQEKLDQRVTQEVTAPQAPPVRGVFLDPRGLLASPDPRAHLVPQEKMDFPDTQGREERLVSKGRPALLDPQVWLDHRDPQVRLDQWEIEATPAPQDPLESRVSLELQGRREPRVMQVLQAPLVKMVPLV